MGKGLPNPLIKILLQSLKGHIKPFLKCPILGRVSIENIVIERKMLDILPWGVYRVTVVGSIYAKGGERDSLNISTVLELYED